MIDFIAILLAVFVFTAIPCAVVFVIAVPHWISWLLFARITVAIALGITAIAFYHNQEFL